MPIIKWDPTTEIDRFFGDRSFTPSFSKLGWDLAVDVFEEKGNVIAKMSLPGIDPADVDIAIDRDTLIITGSRQEEKKAEEKDYFSKEIRRGSFSRIVQLPKSVQAEKAVADYADGVLSVSMPVLKGSEKKPVAVRISKKK